ncbi:SMP-30/gluconolactonase/LRE family protein [Solicola sp. PLA-1-18]|uniref:SMP-30/gluconolactonase/LRE family protein n=1 Tax=Solicola sp. PLA-1-18 TaxID=3380532 RepID=UPI003B7DDFAA
MDKPAISPRRWSPPPRSTRAPDPIGDLRVVPVAGHGTEDVLVLDDGRVLTGLVDGRLVAVTPDGRQQTVVGDSGGRPLGLELLPDGAVLVCDARRGLLRLDLDDGQVTVLAEEVDGRPLTFCNNAAVAADGTIWFTDSSTHLGIDHWRGELLEHVPTGRLVRRDPDGSLEVVLDDLAFGNGVALLPDESAVVVAETAAYALRVLDLTGPRAGTDRVFGTPLPGFPDNISTGDDGLVWVALASPRDPLLDLLLPRAPFLRRAVWALPQALQPQPKRLVHVQAYDAAGRLVHDLAGSHPDFGMPTGVRRRDGHLWLGSLEQGTVAVVTAP